MEKDTAETKDNRAWIYADDLETRYMGVRDLVEEEQSPIEKTVSAPINPDLHLSSSHLPNCAYFDYKIGFQTDQMEKHKILIDYNGDRDFLSDFVFKNYPEKLLSVLHQPENRKYGLKPTDFKKNTFKAKNGYYRDKMTKIVLDNFKDELMAIGVTNDQIIAARNGGRRRSFVMKTAMEHADELRAIGLDETQIKDMEEFGRVPKGFNVHHKFNRFHTAQMGIDYNAPENMIIISCSQFDDYHQKIHRHIDKQTDQISNKEGAQAVINLVWVPGCIYNPDKKMTEAEIIEQSAKEMRRVFKPQNEEEKQRVETAISTLNIDGKINDVVVEREDAKKLVKTPNGKHRYTLSDLANLKLNTTGVGK